MLTRGSVPVPLSHRGLLLLQALTRQPGAVLTKAALMEAAWPGMVVEDGNLTVQIAALRKTLGTRPDGSEWIATVQRVGYRFAGDTAGTREHRASASSPAKPSLAVLPFDNIGGDREQDYFADGVVEDILTALSRFTSFSTIARNSSFVYRGRAVDVRSVASDLGVRYVLHGSVRRAGERLRITAQLVDAQSGLHVWADRFDGSVEDVFDVQDRITVNVATAVEPRIREAEIENARRERPEGIAAYDLFLKALPLHRAHTEPENASAYALLADAVALEPENALFLAWALDILAHRTSMGWPQLSGDDRALIGAYIKRALFQARDDAAVLARCGNALVQVLRDHAFGLSTLRRAVAGNPNSVEAIIWAGIGNLHCGDPDEARRLFERAITLSPNDPYGFLPLTGIAHVEMILGRFEQALAAGERSIAVGANFDPTYWMLIAANAQLGRMDEARRWLERYQSLKPEATLARIAAAQPPDPTRMGAILEGLALAGLN